VGVDRPRGSHHIQLLSRGIGKSDHAIDLPVSPQDIRTFATTTAGLLTLRDWLTSYGMALMAAAGSQSIGPGTPWSWGSERRLVPSGRTMNQLGNGGVGQERGEDGGPSGARRRALPLGPGR
jgi:hypothetical protein